MNKLVDEDAKFKFTDSRSIVSSNLKVMDLALENFDFEMDNCPKLLYQLSRARLKKELVSHIN